MELFLTFEDWAEAQRGPADPMDEWRAVMRQDHYDPYENEVLSEDPEPMDWEEVEYTGSDPEVFEEGDWFYTTNDDLDLPF